MIIITYLAIWWGLGVCNISDLSDAVNPHASKLHRHTQHWIVHNVMVNRHPLSLSPPIFVDNFYKTFLTGRNEDSSILSPVILKYDQRKKMYILFIIQGTFFLILFPSQLLSFLFSKYLCHFSIYSSKSSFNLSASLKFVLLRFYIFQHIELSL